VAIQVGKENALQTLPNNRRLFGDILRLARDLGSVRLQVPLHQHGLFQEVLERMPPPQPLEAGREGSRMAHQDDDFQIKVLRDPVAREGRDRRWITLLKASSATAWGRAGA
jgi:hypothetical protein